MTRLSRYLVCLAIFAAAVGRIRRSIASSNDGAGANLAQETTRTGEVALVNFTAAGNDDGPVLANGVVVTGAP